MNIHNNYSSFFNNIIEINNTNIYKSIYKDEQIKTNDVEFESLVRNKTFISNNYYLCLYDKNNEFFHKWYEWIVKKDTEYEIEYMYGNEPINSPDVEQFHHIEINNKTLIDIDNEIEIFLNIVNESKGFIHLLVDINYLINILKINNKVNHILDFLLYKLEKIPKNIIILDLENKFKINSILYYQFNSLLLNNENNYITNYLTIFKIIDESEDDYYWYIAKPNHNLKLIEEIDLEQSDDLISGIYSLNDKDKCIVIDIKLSSLVKKNLINNMCKEELVINPLERFYEIIH